MSSEPPGRIEHDLMRLRQRDPRAIERWFHEHADALYTFVFYRVGRDAGIAAEVVQETFANAIERLGSYDPARGSMLAWLTWSARNPIRAALRQARRFEQIERWDVIDHELMAAYRRIDESAISAEIVERQETAELVRAALANVPDRYRSLLERHYTNSEPVKRIALSDGLSEGAIKSLLFRARAAFKAAFLTLAESCRGAEPRSGEAR